MGDGVETGVSTYRAAEPTPRSTDDLTNCRRFESCDSGHGLRWGRIAERLLEEVFSEDFDVSRGVGGCQRFVEHRNELVGSCKREYQIGGVVTRGAIDHRTSWDFDLEGFVDLGYTARSDVLDHQPIDPASSPRPRCPPRRRSNGPRVDQGTRRLTRRCPVRRRSQGRDPCATPDGERCPQSDESSTCTDRLPRSSHRSPGEPSPQLSPVRYALTVAHVASDSSWGEDAGGV